MQSLDEENVWRHKAAPPKKPGGWRKVFLTPHRCRGQPTWTAIALKSSSENPFTPNLLQSIFLHDGCAENIDGASSPGTGSGPTLWARTFLWSFDGWVGSSLICLQLIRRKEALSWQGPTSSLPVLAGNPSSWASWWQTGQRLCSKMQNPFIRPLSQCGNLGPLCVESKWQFGENRSSEALLPGHQPFSSEPTAELKQTA